MAVKTIKLAELSREDLELVARWNTTMFLTSDSNEKLIARLYRTSSKRRTQINVQCVVSDGHKSQARATLAAAEKMRIKSAEQYATQEGSAA